MQPTLKLWTDFVSPLQLTRSYLETFVKLQDTEAIWDSYRNSANDLKKVVGEYVKHKTMVFVSGRRYKPQGL